DRGARVGSITGHGDRKRDSLQVDVSEQGRARAGIGFRRSRLQDEIDRPEVSRKKISSRLGRSTTDQVFVRGHDLAEDLIGKVSLGDVAFLELKGRLPNHHESVMFNALAVTLVEHGLTPSPIAARLTYFGAPEALQAAVAAGLLGIGDRFGGSIEQAARILQEAPAQGELRATARSIVEAHRAKKEIIPGLGHPIHKPADP